MIERFGKFGHALYHYSRGVDHRPVVSYRRRKSVSVEHTFSSDLRTLAECESRLGNLYADLQARLQ